MRRAFKAVPLLVPLLPLLGLLAFVAAEPAADQAAYERGKRIFRDNQEGDYASCAMCHSLLAPDEEAKNAEHLGPGYTLYGAAVRKGWRNRDAYRNVAEAAQYCAEHWQERSGGLKAPQQADLLAFLQRHAPPGPLPRRKVERRPKVLQRFGGGDARQGKRLVQRHCGGCHNRRDDALSFPFKPNRRKTLAVARKVRGYTSKGKFKPQDGTMSYFTTERLSDEELRHILAYVGK